MQRQHPVRDRLPRRLVAGDDEEQEHRVELPLGEHLALDLRVDELRDEVVARVGAPLGRDRVAVLEELERRRAAERNEPVRLALRAVVQDVA